MIHIERPKTKEMELKIRELGFLVPEDASRSQLEEVYWLACVCDSSMRDRNPNQRCFGDYVSGDKFCDGQGATKPCAVRTACARMRKIQDALAGGMKMPKKESDKGSDMDNKKIDTTPTADVVSTEPATKKYNKDPKKLDKFGFYKSSAQSTVANIIAQGGKKLDIIAQLSSVLGVDHKKANGKYHSAKNALKKKGFTVVESGKGKEKIVTMVT